MPKKHLIINRCGQRDVLPTRIFNVFPRTDPSPEVLAPRSRGFCSLTVTEEAPPSSTRWDLQQEQRQQWEPGGLQSVQKEPGQGEGSASVLREGQSQGCLQRCLLVDVVILKIKQGSSGELAQPGHGASIPLAHTSQECHPCSLCSHPSPAWNLPPGRRDGMCPHRLKAKGEVF